MRARCILVIEMPDDAHATQALTAYTTITRNYNDLALSQYAHVGRALMLYEMGQQPEGLSELKAMEPRLRGYAEVCTALLHTVLLMCRRYHAAVLARKLGRAATYPFLPPVMLLPRRYGCI